MNIKGFEIPGTTIYTKETNDVLCKIRQEHPGYNGLSDQELNQNVPMTVQEYLDAGDRSYIAGFSDGVDAQRKRATGAMIGGLICIASTIGVLYIINRIANKQKKDLLDHLRKQSQNKDREK